MYVCYTSGTLKICPNLKENVQLVYINQMQIMIVGGYFNISIILANVSMKISTVLWDYIAIDKAFIFKFLIAITFVR